VEILAQSSTAFVLTHNFQGTHILGASRGYLSDSVASCINSYLSVDSFSRVIKLLHFVTLSDTISYMLYCGY